MNLTFIDRITYGTLHDGGKNGLVMFEILFNGKEPSTADVAMLADVINLVYNHPGRNCRKIHFRGPFPINNTHAIFSLLAGFAELRFENYITLDGQCYYSWLRKELVHAISIHLTKPKWTPFPFNELIYDLSDTAFGEPIMPQTYTGRELLYLNPVGTLEKDRAAFFKFIQKAKLRWHLNLSTKPIKEVLWENK